MRDVVRYALPLGPLGDSPTRLFVGRDVRRIFDYRAEARQARAASPSKMRLTPGQVARGVGQVATTARRRRGRR